MPYVEWNETRAIGERLTEDALINIIALLTLSLLQPIFCFNHQADGSVEKSRKSQPPLTRNRKGNHPSRSQRISFRDLRPTFQNVDSNRLPRAVVNTRPTLNSILEKVGAFAWNLRLGYRLWEYNREDHRGEASLRPSFERVGVGELHLA